MAADDSQPTAAADMSIDSLMQLRESLYMKQTAQILFKVTDRLDPAVQKMLKVTQPIIWETIESMDTIKNFCTIMGYFRPNIGDKLPDINGNIVEIDKVSVNQFKSIVRFFIPMALLEHGSEKEIFDFLSNLQYISTIVQPDELMEILKDPQSFKVFIDSDVDLPKDATVTQAINGIIEAVTKPAELYGFNTKNMSTEQINQLSLLIRINNIASTKQ